MVSIVYTSGPNSGNNTNFSYDVFGRRIAIIERTGSTPGTGTIISTKQLVWNGTLVAEEGNASNAVTKRYYDRAEQIGGSSYYYSRDHLGSVREMADGFGTIQARYDYDSYGRTTLLSGSNLSDKQYAGYYAHQPSGLNLTLYRAYDPNTARWLSRDPLRRAEFRLGPNLYGYVSNSPVNFNDSLGMCPCSDAIALTTADSVLSSVLIVGAGGAKLAGLAWNIVGGVGAVVDWASGGSGAPPPGVSSPVDAGAQGAEGLSGQEGIGNGLAIVGALNEPISEMGNTLNETGNQELDLSDYLINQSANALGNCF